VSPPPRVWGSAAVGDGVRGAPDVAGGGAGPRRGPRPPRPRQRRLGRLRRRPRLPPGPARLLLDAKRGGGLVGEGGEGGQDGFRLDVWSISPPPSLPHPSGPSHLRGFSATTDGGVIPDRGAYLSTNPPHTVGYFCRAARVPSRPYGHTGEVGLECVWGGGAGPRAVGVGFGSGPRGEAPTRSCGRCWGGCGCGRPRPGPSPPPPSPPLPPVLGVPKAGEGPGARCGTSATWPRCWRMRWPTTRARAAA